MTQPDPRQNAGARLSIWRQAPSLDGLRTAALGAFACDDASSGATLIRATMDELCAEGFEAVLGPMDGSTWAKYRLATWSDGRPSFLMEPENPAHHVEAFAASGLQIVSRYISSARPADPPEPSSAPPPGLRLRNFDPANAEAELTAIHGLSLATFSRNAFYVPIPLQPFLDSYRPILPALDPDLVFMVENDAGELQGFLFGTPNFAEGPKPQSVILKTYASRAKGAGSMMANAFHAVVHAKGFATVIHALMHDDNLSATHSRNTGGEVFRRYALWGGRL